MLLPAPAEAQWPSSSPAIRHSSSTDSSPKTAPLRRIQPPNPSWGGRAVADGRDLERGGRGPLGCRIGALLLEHVEEAEPHGETGCPQDRQ